MLHPRLKNGDKPDILHLYCLASDKTGKQYFSSKLQFIK